MTDPREIAQRIRKEAVEISRNLATGEIIYAQFHETQCAAILAAEMPRWVPVDERLPELKEIYTNSPKKARVLVYTGYHVMEGELEETFIRRVPVWKDATGRRTAVTHWQPLPSPPREEAK